MMEVEVDNHSSDTLSCPDFQERGMTLARVRFTVPVPDNTQRLHSRVCGSVYSRAPASGPGMAQICPLRCMIISNPDLPLTSSMRSLLVARVPSALRGVCRSSSLKTVPC